MAKKKSENDLSLLGTEPDVLITDELQGPGILFDPTKIKFVDIDDITPNEYNPKDQGTEEYETIKRGIKEKGLRGVIYVRHHELDDGATKPNYEIVDGEQRWRSCSELGYKKVPIYDFEDMPLQEAQEMTIWFEAQVPFNELKVADLVKHIVEAGEGFSLPYSQEQIDEYIKMADFTWEQYKGEMLELEESDGVVHMEVDADFIKKLKKWIQENEPKDRGGDHKRKMVIVATEKYKVLQEQMKVIKQAIETCMIQNDVTSEGRALELIAAQFLSGADIPQEEETLTQVGDESDWIVGDESKKEDEDTNPLAEERDEAVDEFQH